MRASADFPDCENYLDGGEQMAEQIFPEPTVGVFIFNQAGEMLL
jgi:hypothetical protein